MRDGNAVVLLSGGIDSATCLGIAMRDSSDTVALAVDYGQHNRSELTASRALAAHYGCELAVVGIDLSWSLPEPGDPVAEGVEPRSRVPRHYIPARNLLLLSIAIGAAEERGLGRVYMGSNADDSRYPDSRADFAQAFATAAGLGTQCGRDGRPIAVRTPLIGLRKTAVIRTASAYGVPLQLTWSCYEAGDRPCQACSACVLRRQSFAEAGLIDPAATAAAEAG